MPEKKNIKWIRFDDNLLDRIEDYRASLRPVPTFTEAVRQLIEAGLAVKK